MGMEGQGIRGKQKGELGEQGSLGERGQKGHGDMGT